jgi:hypothetical protein
MLGNKKNKKTKQNKTLARLARKKQGFLFSMFFLKYKSVIALI